jgi:hypothetical protein
MGLFDTVTVDVLSADFQTKQLGEGMLTYRLGEDRRLVAPCGVVVVYHGLVHLVGDDSAEFMAVFTYGTLARTRRREGFRRLPLPGARVAPDAGLLLIPSAGASSPRPPFPLTWPASRSSPSRSTRPVTKPPNGRGWHASWDAALSRPGWKN